MSITLCFDHKGALTDADRTFLNDTLTPQWSGTTEPYMLRAIITCLARAEHPDVDPDEQMAMPINVASLDPYLYDHIAQITYSDPTLYRLWGYARTHAGLHLNLGPNPDGRGYYYVTEATDPQDTLRISERDYMDLTHALGLPRDSMHTARVTYCPHMLRKQIDAHARTHIVRIHGPALLALAMRAESKGSNGIYAC